MDTIAGSSSGQTTPLFSAAGAGLGRRADVQVYAILDEVFLAGEIEETSKQVVLDRLDYLEKLE